MQTSSAPIPAMQQTLEVLKNELFFIAPEIALTIVGLCVLIFDFTYCRKRSEPSRRRVLGFLTFFGVGISFLIALAMALPVPYGFDLASRHELIFFGTIATDGISCWMNVVLLGLLALIIAQSMTTTFTDQWGEYFALLCWAGVGMMLLIAAEELLTLFLTLETMTLCLYMVASFEKGKKRSAEGGLKYFVYGSVSSALFLFGLSLLYGMAGTTRLDALRFALANPSSSDAVGLTGNIAGATAVLLVLVGFGFKIAAVPFHQWAPDAYEGAPAPVTAWIATGSKIASFVAMIKVLVGALSPWAMRMDNFASPGWIGILALIAAATMTFGNFAALAQTNLKRMLAYSSIAHAGYMLVGVLAASVAHDQSSASAPILFYLVVYAISTVGAFAVATWIVRDKGTDEIDDLNGLGAKSPILAVCIVLLMLSLIGMPPLAGFFGKLYMFMEAMSADTKGRLPLTWLVFLGLFNSVVSAFYYVRVLRAMFLRPAVGPSAPAPRGVVLSIVVATLVVVGVGLYPAPLLNTMRAASQSRASRIGGSNGPMGTDLDAATIKRLEAERIEDERLMREKAALGIRAGGGPAGGGPR